MIIKINGTDVSNKLFTEQGYIIKDTYSFDDLDSVTYNFYFNDDVDIKASDIIEINSKQWVVGTVDKSISEKKPIRYKASIICLELTKLLERFILSPCAFTNKDDTMTIQIQKALDKAVLRRDDETSIFRLETYLTTILLNIPGQDYFFNELVTLREVLDTMLSTQKFRCEVEEIRDGLIVITARPLGINAAITELSTKGLITKRELHSLENYGSQYETMVDNVYPSKNDNDYQLTWEQWQPLKPVTTEILDTNNAQLVVSFPIEEIIEAKVQWGAEVEISTIQPDMSILKETKYYGLETDLTDVIVEEEIYNAMAKDDQEKHFPYSKGSTSIGVLKSYKILLFPRVRLVEIINTANKSTELMATLEAEGYDNIYDPEGEYPLYEIIHTDITTGEVFDLTMYSIKYKSYQNQHYSISKNSEDSFNGGTILQNPNTSQIDSERFGTNMLEVAKSGGNRLIYYDYIHDNISDVMTLGTRVAYGLNSILTLTERELAVYKGQIKAHYMFEVDFVNPVNAKLNRERRAFVNPINNFVKRDILIKDKVIIGSLPNTDDLGLIKKSTLNYAFQNTLNHDQALTKPIDLAIMYTGLHIDNDNAKPLANYQLQMHSIGIANSIRYHFECLDNYSVGLSKGRKVIGGYSVNLNPYVNAIGELEDLELDMSISYLRTDEDTFTFTQKLEIGEALPLHIILKNEADEDIILPLVSNKTKFKIRKDTFEQLTFTYQLEFLGDGSNVIIGNELIKLIEIVNGHQARNYYIWVSDERYYKTDTKYCKGTVTAYQPIKDTDSIKNPMPSVDYSNYNAWAIGTDTGELIVAVNNYKATKPFLTMGIVPYKTTFNV